MLICGNQYHKDGAMRFFGNLPNPDTYCAPNSFGGPAEDRSFANIAAAMRGVPDFIVKRQIECFRQVHAHFGAGVCATLDAVDPQF